MNESHAYRVVQDDDKRGLAEAFQEFSEMSAQLAASYQQLQDHVSELQQELMQSNREKLQVSRDKQHLASRLEHLLELLPGGVVVLDSKGTVQQVNPVAMDFLGDDLLGKRWMDVIGEKFSPRVDDGHEISLVDGRRLSIATRSIPGSEGSGQIVLLTDQTQTRALQEQLSRRDRLSTMGKMVAYLAHQIRTPLSSAMLYAGHLQNPELDADRKTDFSSKLVRQLKNVEQQISDLLIFARGSKAGSDALTVSELFSRLRREIDATATLEAVEVTCSNTVEATLNCNPQALISAILNLVNNAREAHADQPLEQRLKVKIYSERHGEFLAIHIEDNGPGIEDSEMNRVLEPFYTTKAKGTGLGLAVVQAVAKSLGGDLSLAPASQGGLTVTLTIPLTNS